MTYNPSASKMVSQEEIGLNLMDVRPQLKCVAINLAMADDSFLEPELRSKLVPNDVFFDLNKAY